MMIEYCPTCAGLPDVRRGGPLWHAPRRLGRARRRGAGLFSSSPYNILLLCGGLYGALYERPYMYDKVLSFALSIRWTRALARGLDLRLAMAASVHDFE